MTGVERDFLKAALGDWQQRVGGSRYRRSRGQSESLLAWLPVVTDHTGSDWRVASATRICGGALGIAVRSAVAIASQRLLLTIANFHRPLLTVGGAQPTYPADIDPT